MHRLIALVAIIVTAMTLGLSVSGCSKDCPTCPTDKPVEHYKGWLYYSDCTDQFNGVTLVDMETDSIVDSIRHEGPAMGTLGIDVSPDGRYLAVGFTGINDDTRETRIYDAQTLQLLTVLPKLYDPLFDPGSGMLIGELSHSLTWINMPSGQVVREDTLEDVFLPCDRPFDLLNHLIYGNSVKANPFRSEFASYDYVNHELEYVPIHVAPGDTVQVIQACVDVDRNRLFFHSIRWFNGGRTLLMGYDLNTLAVLWTFPTLSEVGSVAVSPDGSEVWMTDPGQPGYIFDSGTIYIFDAASGAYLQGISLFGYGSNPLSPLAGSGIIFSPTGEKAYVATGYAADRPTGSVLVVDTKLKKIIKVLTPDYMRSPMRLCIGPKT
jgi:DNA-binding beta-propeller fold protein YncE